MDKIFFEIEPRKQNNEIIYVAKIQMSELLKEKRADTELTSKVEHLENLYRETIEFCKQQLNAITNTSNQQKIFLYWDIADKLWQFLTISDKTGFFLNYANKHFARDLKVSERTIRRLLMFRKNVNNKLSLDSAKSWTYYTRRYYRLKRNMNNNE